MSSAGGGAQVEGRDDLGDPGARRRVEAADRAGEAAGGGEADFIVAKHRNGPTDTITVAFHGMFSRFVDMPS